MSTLPVSNDDRAMWDIWLSHFRLPITSAHDEIGTFRALSESAMTTDELGTALGVDTRALGIHLGVLASMDLVERRDGRWQATDTTRRWLHPDAEGYYGAMIARYGTRAPLHAQLLETLTTGDKASANPTAVEDWEAGEMSAEQAADITAFMHAHSRATARGAAEQHVFGDVRRLLDVGGGSGVYCIEIARANAGLRATVMEIEAICRVAERYIAESGVQERVDTIAVDMFREAWPSGYDAHFFSNVFHDWSEDTNRELARRSFAALPSGGRILLSEILMDDDGCGPYPAAAFSLLMLLGTRGRQYSFVELRDILESAGFTDVSSVRTGGGYYSLVSATKP